MDFTSFRIDLAYSDEEMSAYEAIVWRHQQSQADRHVGYSWAVVATGALLALVVAMLAFVLGITTRDGGGLAAVLIFAGFYLGVWTPTWWGWLLNRRTRQARWAESRAAWADTTLAITSRGIHIRRARSRGHYAWSAIERVTRDGDLILLWMKAESPFAIPARLLTPEQVAILLSKTGTRPDRPDTA